MSKASDEFVHQMTRKKLVDWCEKAISDPNRTLQIYDRVSELALFRNLPYVEFAIGRKWVSRDGDDLRILAAGFETATRFLKR